MKSPVEVGFAFEEKILNLLKECGLEAWRTNASNSDAPAELQADVDCGVDIIARYKTNTPINKAFAFYIQCKCRKDNITTQAINEVYGGMHSRNGVTKQSFAVVVATSSASIETKKYAKKIKCRTNFS